MSGWWTKHIQFWTVTLCVPMPKSLQCWSPSFSAQKSYMYFTPGLSWVWLSESIQDHVLLICFRSQPNILSYQSHRTLRKEPCLEFVWTLTVSLLNESCLHCDYSIQRNMDLIIFITSIHGMKWLQLRGLFVYLLSELHNIPDMYINFFPAGLSLNSDCYICEHSFQYFISIWLGWI